MSPLQIALEKVLSTACSLVAGRLMRDVSEPGPYDDAQQEMEYDLLDAAIAEYAAQRLRDMGELENDTD